MPQIKKITVLFLCTGNSARSQMAEALLRAKGADKFEVYSAGTHPEQIDERALNAIRVFGLSSEDLKSQNINEFAGKKFDYVITLCDKANNECRHYPGAIQQLAWDFPDPKTRLTDKPFISTLNELNSRISMFLLIVSKSDTSRETESTFDPISFYKCLTDDIRLKTLMLTHYHGELCVCELMHALQEESQPKVSRNLAVLKKANILSARKHEQWVFYRINYELPQWAKSVIAQTTENNSALISESLLRLAALQTRPNKVTICD